MSKSDSDLIAEHHALVRKVAVELAARGFRFTYSETEGRDLEGKLYSTAYLTHADGRSISLRLDTGKKRISIASVIPRHDADRRTLYFGEDLINPRATVAAERAPAAIAREIERKILPDYTHDFALYQAALAERGKDKDAQETALALLRASKLVSSVQTNQSNQTREAYFYSAHSERHVRGTVTDGTIELRLPNLTAAQTLRVLAALAIED